MAISWSLHIRDPRTSSLYGPRGPLFHQCRTPGFQNQPVWILNFSTVQWKSSDHSNRYFPVSSFYMRSTLCDWSMSWTIWNKKRRKSQWAATVRTGYVNVPLYTSQQSTSFSNATWVVNWITFKQFNRWLTVILFYKIKTSDIRDSQLQWGPKV